MSGVIHVSSGLDEVEKLMPPIRAFILNLASIGRLEGNRAPYLLHDLTRSLALVDVVDRF